MKSACRLASASGFLILGKRKDENLKRSDFYRAIDKKQFFKPN